MTNEKLNLELLCYGKILTDDEYKEAHDGKICSFIRIRTIEYKDYIFYHKMVNGNVTKIKVLK